MSSPEVPLGFTIASRAWSSASVYINTNGAITFSSPYVGYPGEPEEGSAGGVVPPLGSSAQPIVSAFLSDIDTSAPAVGTITYGSATLNGRPVFVVNYSNVAGFSFAPTDFDRRRNSFQIVLVERSDTGAGNFDIELNYDQIQWEAADSNGGTDGVGGYTALAGYSDGAGASGMLYELPGSGIPGSFTDGADLSLVAGSQNSGVPGRYVLAIRNTTAPAITSLSPATIVSSSPEFTLTVNGSGFASGSTVLWNGAAMATTFVSAAQLTATIATSLIATPETATVGVITGGMASHTVSFTVTPIPAATITSLNPASSQAGSAGFTLAMNGSGFTYDSTVLWNGAPLPAVFVSASQMTAGVEADLLASPGTAVVTASAGGVASNGVIFTVTAAPSITSVSPSTVPAGSSAFLLTVNGSGFNAGSILMWNGAPLSTSFVGPTQLTATVPDTFIASPGSCVVAVSNSGAVSNAAALSILIPVPTVTSLSPSSTPAGVAGFTLTLTGSGFTPGSVVFWNGIPQSTGFVSATQVTAMIPSAFVVSPGIANVTLNAGGLTSNSVAFTISAAGPPAITGLSPTAIQSGGPSFTLTVNGSGFGNSQILWNGAAMPTTVVNANQLTAPIPAELIAKPGTANVTVRTGRTASNALTFAINAAEVFLNDLGPSRMGVGSAQAALTVTVSAGGLIEWSDLYRQRLGGGQASETRWRRRYRRDAPVVARTDSIRFTASIRFS